MMPNFPYDDTWPARLIDHLKDGKSFESFGAKVLCGKTTLYKMLDLHPELREAKEIGEAMDIDWSENILKAHIIGHKTKDFDSTRANLNALIFKMKTRHYKVYGNLERHEVEATVNDKRTILINKIEE